MSLHGLPCLCDRPLISGQAWGAIAKFFTTIFSLSSDPFPNALYQQTRVAAQGDRYVV
ncbi:hypothetical protein [Leptolyngbya sp. CCY15150]|uniref:hypothetical protein n=1 Tax=Leptolyngbya sp. CCY15150 TaxID=2767772 RepID=UPI001950C028|nr:hypothetical protein [Leptolyngbya sp. CCY15150]